ncbi:hypothetical protein [Nocardioides sp. Leaf285]|uniref:hypothetical protein n=1 Tax=Nocardioides sp. Leaf285 TaxID=1736322 RepID=UPI0012E9F55B|nr:hypothetical protein [Nocardioides sp. Leaf285]
MDDVALGARIAPPPGVGAEADSVYVVAAINTRGSARFVRAHDAMNPARSVEFYAPRNGTMDAYPTPGWRQRRAERRAAKGHHS